MKLHSTLISSLRLPQPDCSLHLHMDIDAQDRNYQTILSQDSAIGLIMAQGMGSEVLFRFVCLIYDPHTNSNVVKSISLPTSLQAIWGVLSQDPLALLDSTSLVMEASPGQRSRLTSGSSNLLL